jgi:tetratricopeptide (TPR) repeat protein
MGEVYEAEQTAPIHRRVAIKLMKRGMDTQAGIARFEAERQALAVMDHPSIAKVFDAGSTPDGRLYFVMEIVKGVPITKYCDAERLSNRERLGLFTQVCEGIQHAHQKGIIHRDIKASNVLVSLQDQKPVPKIIDFGIAKAIGPPLTEQAIHTEVGQFIGTPEYMSPEQAGLTGLDIDTRTDVYSLGVLLYELVVGSLPFDSQELRRRGYDEIRSIIRQEEPRKPSTRVGAPDFDAAAAGRNRQTDPGALKKQLHGEVDWIVMKAMAKDRARRYSGASELAADIARHLRNEPVLAGPPSNAYRVRKYVLRHRLGVAAAAIVAAALVTGISGTTFGLIRARRAEKTAVAEAERAKQVSDFLVQIFGVSDPSESRGNTITAREILDRGAQKIEDELQGQPVVQAGLMHSMGKVYQSLGLYAPAERLLARALELRRGLDRGTGLPSGQVLQTLGELQYYQGRYDESLATFKQVLAIRESNLGENHPEVAAAANDLGVLLMTVGRFDEAEPALARALGVRERALGPDHPSVGETVHNLGTLYGIIGKRHKAEDMLRRSLAIREKAQGPDHPEVAGAAANLAWTISEQGRYREALPFCERALSIREKVLPADHIDIALSLQHMGELYVELDELDRADAFLKRAETILGKNQGPEHIDLAAVLELRAVVAKEKGLFEEARGLLERSLRIKERTYSAETREIAITLGRMANLFRDTGRYESAHELYRRVLGIRQKAIGPQSLEVGIVLGHWSQCYFLQGRFEDAESLARRSLAITEAAASPQHPFLAWSMSVLADVYRETGRIEEARTLYGHALEIWKKGGLSDHKDARRAIAGLAKCDAR